MSTGLPARAAAGPERPGKTMNETPAVNFDPSSIQARQVQEATRHNDLLEKMFMMETAPQFLQHLDDLAREIEDANQAEGAENKKGVLNLLDYLDWLDFYHNTEEKQRLIQRLRNDLKFREFRKELHEFEEAIERLQLSFLADRAYQFDRLHSSLDRLDSYTLTID
jgi:uncharacterized protein YeeX (DUF496 family)